MSFILNALRKSEQERQSLQPEAVTDRILINHSEPQLNRSPFFYTALVVGNILIIIAIVWFVNNRLKSSSDVSLMTVKSFPVSAEVVKSEPIATQVQQDTSIKVLSDVNPDQQTGGVRPESVVNPIKMETVVKPDQVAEQLSSEKILSDTKSNTSSISEWVESQIVKVDPSEVKPVIKKKTENEEVKTAGKVAIPAKFEQASKVIPVIKEDVKRDPSLADEIRAKNDIPFLNELPYEVRRSVPKLTINVFVYSENPEESFVMIDMVKVKTGQSIQEGMVLREIRADSLVIAYQGRVFQVGR